MHGFNFDDLQKYFHKIDHEIFLMEMEYIEFLEKVISWFELYLLERTFKVNIDKNFFDPGIVLAAFPKDLY